MAQITHSEYFHRKYIQTNAVQIAEGVMECDDEATYLEAWQYLVDTGLCWQLQGWFGRTAKQLIHEGYIHP